MQGCCCESVRSAAYLRLCCCRLQPSLPPQSRLPEHAAPRITARSPPITTPPPANHLRWTVDTTPIITPPKCARVPWPAVTRRSQPPIIRLRSPNRPLLRASPWRFCLKPFRFARCRETQDSSPHSLLPLNLSKSSSGPFPKPYLSITPPARLCGAASFP